MVHVGPKFLIWDEEECGILIRYIAESLHKDFVKNFPAGQIYELFSTAKERAKTDPTKGIEEIIKEELEYWMEGEPTSSTNDNPLYDGELILRLFDAYSRTLKESNALDFTDLLTKGLDLLKATYWAREIGRLEHVLVDEFQDTSSLQYLIVKELFKVTKGSISVVGDPDQSSKQAVIYYRPVIGLTGTGMKFTAGGVQQCVIMGFEDNTVFEQMKNDLPQTKEIYLEENYRSTASNIAAAINIISQDEKRPPKTLFTSHTPEGPKPVKKGFPTTNEEDAFISQEINRLLVESDGVIGYGDCAILFRSNYTALEFAQTLLEAKIPYRLFPERSLNDQVEVKNLLAFLRLAIDDAHTPMLIRAMTGPFEVQKQVE
ncbi:hypothetical protein FRC11_013731 [Ceratobasidium sp. 423]|nr:hypothetical protein FRC11_013731 [Ceratobasidium sp. 423]